MITLRVKKLQSLTEKSIGLIGKKPVKPVYFTTRWGIHTFGVLASIDVVILDGDNRIVKLVRNMAPNRILFWNPKFDRVIELPAGTIEKEGVTAGDTVILKFVPH